MNRLCFIHGWAYAPNLWHDLSQALPETDQTFIDLGFFGEEKIPEGLYDIVITHSYGLMWLLQNPYITYKKLVSVNGIAAYAKSGPHSVPESQLRAMRLQLNKDPQTLLENFYKTCGDHTYELLRKPSRTALNKALRDMETLDLRSSLPDRHILALASQEDKIVPAALTKENFAGHPIIWHKGDSHILPKAEPDWCAARIREFINA